MGDTDGQSIAGALATGTHGTGLRAPAFSSQVAALRLMLADGSVVETSEESDPELFRAARVSLGALGIVIGVTLRAPPMYWLRRVDTIVSRDEALRLIADPPPVDHVGVWLMPYADKAVVWQSVRVSEPGPPPSKRELWLKDVVQVNAGLTVAGFVGRRWPKVVPALDRVFASSLRADERTDRADNIFIRPISIRHDAFAYAVPLERGPEACRALLTAIERTRPGGVLPCEIRFAGAEDAWLHPQYGRQTAWIGSAMHAPGFDPAPCWTQAEEACLALGGRPHWGKWHTRSAAELAAMYPEWARFQALRARLDPGGRFGSPPIDRLLGPVQRS
jgi:L-gulonolactone oxidase